MGNPEWVVYGYIETSGVSEASMCTPVLRRSGDTSNFLQIDYLCSPPRFMIHELADECADQVRPVDARACDPDNDLVVFVRCGNKLIYGDIGENREVLLRLMEKGALSAAVQTQLQEIFTGSVGVTQEIARMIPERFQRYFSVTQSADAVFQITLHNIKPDIDRAKALRVAHGALSAIHNWEIDEKRISELAPLLEITGLSFTQFSAAFKSRGKEISISEPAPVGEVLERSWESIRRLGRQERRLARLLRIYIEEPETAASILQVYKSPNYLETRAVSDIAQMIAEQVVERSHRAMQVAYFVPRLVRMEFGAQRGKLLYDLALELGTVQQVREVLVEEFHRRRHTWSVASWGQEFEYALQTADPGGWTELEEYSPRLL